MDTIIEWLALLITLLGVVTSGSIAFLVYRASRQAQRAENQREIGHLYDRLIDFREKHPVVMRLGRTWTAGCFEAMYRQSTSEERDWVLYYTYAELACSFSSAVLSGWKMGLIDREVYEKYYRRLVRLVLTEHYPYIKSVNQGKYLSRYITEYIAEARKGGWDWDLNHHLLANDARQVPNKS